MKLHWIETFTKGRIAIMTRPRGGDWLDVDLAMLVESGIGAVVSCLTPQEELELELGNERDSCRRAGLHFLSCPLEDRGVPSSIGEVSQLLDQLTKLMEEGTALAIHCRQGIGRSSLLTATLMVSHGIPSDRAFSWLAEARGRPLPDTEEQRKWVDKFELHCAHRDKA